MYTVCFSFGHNNDFGLAHSPLTFVDDLFWREADPDPWGLNSHCEVHVVGKNIESCLNHC